MTINSRATNTRPNIAGNDTKAVILGKEFGQTVMSWLGESTKGGYWFTIVLLYMFIVYYVFCFFESRLPSKSWISIALLFVVSLCFYDTCYQPRHFSWAMGYRGIRSEFICYTSLDQLFMYFPFFIYGNIVRRYWDQTQRLMDSKWFYPIVIVLAVFSAGKAARV